MKLNLKLSHKAFILIAVPLLFELVFVGALALLWQSAEQEATNDMRSKDIIAKANTIATETEEAFITLYSYNKDPDAIALERYRSKMQDIKDNLNALAEMTADRPSEIELVKKAMIAYTNGEDLGNWVLDAIKRGESLEEKDQLLHGRLPMRVRVFKVSRDLTYLVHRLGKLEENRSIELSKRRSRGLMVPIFIFGVIANVLLALMLAWFFNSGTQKRLRVLMDNSNRLARGATLSQRLEGGDELAELDRLFHHMADDLREAMAKEHAVVANAVDVICSVDEKLFFRSLSPAANEVFGRSPEDLTGLKLASLILPEDFEATVKDFERARDKGDKPFFENRIKRNDAIVDVRWSAYWSNNEQAYYCVVSDISARREIERLKQEFVSMMSHDLRTPLMSIQASLSILSAGATGDLSASARNQVEDAERNIAYIISLINSLIDMERMDASRLQVHRTDTELLPLLEAAVQAIRGLATHKGITIAVENVDPDLEVNADGDRVIQLLINLMSNALEFSSKGTTISLRIALLTDFVEVSVCDQGRGIPASDLNSVFDRFKQVKATDATQHKGFGLGLAICKTIVEEHGGEIGVKSVEGKGTTFYFTLPLGAHPVDSDTKLDGTDQGSAVSIL